MFELVSMNLKRYFIHKTIYMVSTINVLKITKVKFVYNLIYRSNLHSAMDHGSPFEEMFSS